LVELIHGMLIALNSATAAETPHLVDGTIMAKYLKQNRVQLQEAKESIAFYLQGENSGLELKEELTKMLKQ
jgi:hypothetical protein